MLIADLADEVRTKGLRDGENKFLIFEVVEDIIDFCKNVLQLTIVTSAKPMNSSK